MKPLKPVMAAILAASSLALPSARTASADEPTQLSDAAAHEKAVTHDKEFVARLISLVDAKPEVRADVSARLVKFIQNREKGRQYLTTGLLDDKTLIKGAVGEATKWPDDNIKDPGKVAALYYVLGPDVDKVPAWAPAGYDDEFKPNPVWSGRLAKALSDEKWDTTKQVAQSGAVAGTTALLDSAATWAQKILDDARTKGEVHDSIVSNATTAPIPPTTKEHRNPLDTTGSAFGFDDLYVKGAVVANVYAPHDDGYRTVSIKVYTTKTDDGTFINKIGLVDITKPDIASPSPTQWIDGSKAGDTDVVFRDGGRHYTATVNSDGTVTLKRAGTNDGEGGSISTSKDELSAKRDDQITSGGTVMIGEPPLPYYVLGQGGQKGSFLFFSQAQMDAMKAAREAGQQPNLNAHPDLMGDVVQSSSDGTQQIKGKPDLGTLPNGDPYHLEFDLATRMWKVVKGKGDVPPPKTDPANSANSDPANPNPANPNPAGPAAPAPKNLEEAIAAAKADKPDKTKVWVEDAGNDGFDAATKARIRIMSNTRDSDGMTHFKVLFDPALGVNNAEFEFQAINKDVRLLHVRGVKNFVALEYGTGTQYYDLQNFANYVQHVYDASLAYAQAGSYAVSDGVGKMQDVTSADIVQDILTRYLKVKPDDAMLATVRARIEKHAAGKGYVINGDATKLYLGVGEEGRTIWPDDIASGDTGTNEKMTGLRGPGTAVDVAGGQPGAFQKEMNLGSGRVATLVKTENNAALYASTEDETAGGKTTSVKVWSIMIEYKKNKLPSRSKALPVFGSGKDRYMLPAGLHMQGLPNLDLPDSTLLMMQYGSNQENGAIAAYRYVLPDAQGGQNAKDKPGNCAGPVLWWGSVTKEQAQVACDGDSKIK